MSNYIGAVRDGGIGVLSPSFYPHFFPLSALRISPRDFSVFLYFFPPIRYNFHEPLHTRRSKDERSA